MNTLAFYNLSVEFRGLLAEVEANDGLLTPEVEARLAELEPDLEARVAHLALACREWDRTAAAVEAEEYRLAARKRSLRKSIANVRDLMAEHMAETGTPRVKSDLVTVSLVRGVERYVWDGKDENIPEPYRLTLVEYRLDREAVARDVGDGKPLPEGMRARRESYVKIT